ncbi:MAG: undecaprenyldiphospho-muramoylpentapeptide beta-N-acetylglucosaminyltransferase, partial [Acidobacteria bacterium]|nr:undecaprenyldiphospho-muramoylpentapeptide beta-N-acetylglucosaminyltransferase [Acidobacteriota bacterium]NIM60260.1 undecaprenyldiphospho-muramoylpentapeptide beta-N-acetylglucosaminyltransferase [Acidobacteriota bacterium]NIO60298.1 undecaprenyldiphospho-muramoylpentapeptide beta-N-acetylglucosaminyltransferase [Acidobacteriota bacterium]NIQ31353.1 undecaprenyldiphospho-muramoylpentapeptide beta-N-acetylglucosaminyltransferase [Acidobacteriota bacterium]NIQ86576.1 undecaprenyldiphospho-mu
MDGEGYKIVFAGGGTGGHLYPGLVVAAALRDELGDAADITFIGAQRGIEQRLVPQAGYPLVSLRVAGIKGRGALAKLGAAFAAARALLRCFFWMRRHRPDLVVGVGGYASGPAVLAATWTGVKTMVLEQNHFPGATNRWLAPRVDAVCVPSEDARKRLDGIGTVTGNPVRAEFFETAPPSPAARPSLLVFGGSRGAHSINRAMSALVPELARFDPAPRVVHQCGEADAETVRDAARAYPRDLYEVQVFLDDMPARLAAADLVVCRAGASTLAELTAAGRPAVLVPYPHAADDHQRHNAESLARVGAARVVTDAELDDGRLVGVLEELLGNPEAIRRMGECAKRIGKP